MLDDVRTRAANPEHPWDVQAIDWPELTPESVVVEVGGYCGRWALQIAERYHPRLFVFEPQPWAFDVCKAALGDNATVLNFGLGNQDTEHGMGDWGTDGCSFTKPSGVGPVNFGLMREIGSVFTAWGIDAIDLMLINIEGYEYTLIPHMLGAGIRPKRLMVQAHGDLDILIRQLDAAGYRVLWTYGAVLTAWELT